MPWTVADVDSHKKGLTAKQKKQWVEVANGALKAGDDDAAAIRKANGVVGNSRQLVWNEEAALARGVRHLMSSLVRKQKFSGVEHLVVPTVLICEGVHNGLYYGPGELEKFPEAWNGRPVTVGHPQAWDGSPVSANTPDMLQDRSVGFMFNCQYREPTGNSLAAITGEAWLVPARLAEVDGGAEVQAFLDAEKPIEVSTGLYLEEKRVTNQWRGEQYRGEAINHRPDHLALLPGAKGACSWADGAGAPRVNADQLQPVPVTDNELSHDEVDQRVYEAVRTARKVPSPMPEGYSGPFVGVVRVYDKLVIYEVYGGGKSKMYRQAYTVDAKDQVTLSGDPVEVVRKVEFVPVANDAGGPAANAEKPSGEGEHAARASTHKEGEVEMDKQKRIAALIANELTPWVEGDQKILETLSDDQLKAHEEFAAKAKGDADRAAQAEATVKAKDGEIATLKAATKPEAKTAEEFIANAPEGIRDVLTSGLTSHREQHTRLVEVLSKREGCPFTAEQLKAKPIGELRQLVTLAGLDKTEDGAPVDFSRPIPAPAANADADKIPEPPTLNWDKPTVSEGARRLTASTK